MHDLSAEEGDWMMKIDESQRFQHRRDSIKPLKTQLLLLL